MMGLTLRTPVTAIDKMTDAPPIEGSRVDAREAADLLQGAASVGVVCQAGEVEHAPLGVLKRIM